MKSGIYLLLVGIMCLSGCSHEGTSHADAAAVTAAKDWLSLVDNEQYAESWEQAAEYFKAAVGQDEWTETMQSMRKPFGKMLSREVRLTQHKTELPGAPDGEYVVIQFKTSFEHKKSAIETITPMLAKDGQWRVSGYFMK